MSRSNSTVSARNAQAFLADGSDTRTSPANAANVSPMASPPSSSSLLWGGDKSFVLLSALAGALGDWAYVVSALN